jgi:UDP-3-O-[3-hydroxymyristoyl] glucosamine N-acyltransferase
MKLNREYTAAEIAQLIGAKVLGNPETILTGVNEIHKVSNGDITFVDVSKYFNKVLTSKATGVVINQEIEVPLGKVLFFVDTPFDSFNFLQKHFSNTETIPTHQTQNYHFGTDCSIHPSAIIHPNVVIGNHVTIGENSIIHPNVTIYDRTIIGSHVEIHANTVIGGHAYYYKTKPEGYDKLHSSGRTIIHNHVEIGCSCTIDKGVSGDTIIGEGTKLDNQVHLGHGVEIGEYCLIGAQVGIGGKTIIGNRVIIWGQAGITKGIHIGDGAIISAQSGVSKSLEGGKAYFGTPAEEIKKHHKFFAKLRMLVKES